MTNFARNQYFMTKNRSSKEIINSAKPIAPTNTERKINEFPIYKCYVNNVERKWLRRRLQRPSQQIHKRDEIPSFQNATVNGKYMINAINEKRKYILVSTLYSV